MPLEDNQQREQARLIWSGFFNSRFQLERGTSIDGLDYELELLDEYRLLAKRQRNARVTAYKLPVELLSMIFIHLCDIWHPRTLDTRDVFDDDSDTEDESEPGLYESDDDDTRYDLGWTAVTRVCSQWRKVALSTPALWHSVECAHVSPCHRRIVFQTATSSNTPLRLALDYDDKPKNIPSVSWTRKWLTPSICERISQLELINLSLAEDRLMDVLQALNELPHLTWLTIQRRRAEFEEREPTFIDFPLPIPSPFRLERVSFFNCYPPLSSPLYSSNLTHLSLELICDVFDPEMPDVDTMITLLSTMHRLEELKLDSVPRPSFSGPPSSHNTSIYTLPASFRSFTHSAYGEDILPAIDLLARLKLPPHVDISMEFDLAGSEEEDDTVFARVSETVFRSIDMPLSSTCMLQVDLWSGCIVFNKTLRAGAPTMPREDWRFPLHHLAQGEGAHVHLERLGGYPDSHAMGFLRLLPITQLTCLMLDSKSLEYCFPHNSGSPTMPELDALHSLTHISVGLPSTSSFFKQIGAVRTIGAKTVPKLFPNLVSITLQRDIKKLVLNDDILQEKLEPALSALSPAFYMRQQSHSPIRQLFVNKFFERALDWEKIPKALDTTFFEWPPSGVC